VVFGRKSDRGHFAYVGMSEFPFHPQGFGQHGDSDGAPIDRPRGGWGTTMGRHNHLGKRIPFNELPTDCRRLVCQDYKAIWGLA
jgi:hypothetical protein